MIIRCRETLPDGLPPREREVYDYRMGGSDPWYVKGELYPVFGFGFDKNVQWYLTCDLEGDREYPLLALGMLFHIVDGTLGADWVAVDHHTNVGDFSVLPRRWAEDPSFLEKIVDGNSDALDYYLELRGAHFDRLGSQG